jgi:hypothetical protein
VETRGPLTVRITARNAGGDNETDAVITVTAPAPAVSYPNAPARAVVGEYFGPVAPASEGGEVVGYEPVDLPPGVDVAEDGTIAGTPTAPWQGRVLVRAVNSGGACDAGFELSVEEPLAVVTYEPQSLNVGTEMAPSLPTVVSGVVSPLLALRVARVRHRH